MIDTYTDTCMIYLSIYIVAQNLTFMRICVLYWWRNYYVIYANAPLWNEYLPKQEKYVFNMDK